LDLGESTLAVTTDRGHVRLTGTLQDKRDLLHLESLVSHFKGVRRIESEVTISVERHRRDSRLAQRLNKAIANLYPRERISLTVVGGTVVLQGRVRLLATKRSVERFMSEDNAVERVVNKLEVTRVR
jgi:osmotically-inducible protein OsmY